MSNTFPPSLNTNAPSWFDGALEDAWKKFKKIKSQTTVSLSLSKYENDPVGFGREYLGEYYTDDAIKIMESVRDNTITIARSATDVGKSHTAARLAVWFFSVFNDSKVYTTAAPPIDNLRQILWGEIGSIIRTRPSLVSGCRLRGLLIQKHDEHFIAGVAIPLTGTSAQREAKFSGRHAPHLFFIVDEGDAVPDEVYKGIEGCMSGGNMVRLLIMFNPRVKVGPVYNKEMKRQANVVEMSALTHPNVVEGRQVIPGAVTREVTIRRVHEWTRPLSYSENPSADCFELPEFLVGQEVESTDGKMYPPLQPGWRKIVDPSFNYMVLGQYPDLGSAQLISEDWIDLARSRWDAYVAQNGEHPPTAVRPIMGIDMAEFGADSNVACFRYGGFVARLVTWNGVDPDNTASRALELYREKNARIAHVDGTGVGAGVAPSMARKGRSLTSNRELDVRAFSIKVSSKPSNTFKTDIGEFYILRDQIWWLVREWLRTDTSAMLPPDSLLVEELKAVSYEVKNGKIRVSQKDDIRKLIKRSPDRADALCLTFSPFDRAKWIRIDQQGG